MKFGKLQYWAELFPQKEAGPAAHRVGVGTLATDSASAPGSLLTQLQLQCLDEGVVALVTEEASEVVHVHCPNHGPAQALLLQVAGLCGEQGTGGGARGSLGRPPHSPSSGFLTETGLLFPAPPGQERSRLPDTGPGWKPRRLRPDPHWAQVILESSHLSRSLAWDGGEGGGMRSGCVWTSLGWKL